jgi:hypothetical protein
MIVYKFNISELYQYIFSKRYIYKYFDIEKWFFVSEDDIHIYIYIARIFKNILDMISIEIDLYIARIFENKNAYDHEIKSCENKIIIVYLNCIFSFGNNDFFKN